MQSHHVCSDQHNCGLQIPIPDHLRSTEPLSSDEDEGSTETEEGDPPPEDPQLCHPRRRMDVEDLTDE